MRASTALAVLAGASLAGRSDAATQCMPAVSGFDESAYVFTMMFSGKCDPNNATCVTEVLQGTEFAATEGVSPLNEEVTVVSYGSLLNPDSEGGGLGVEDFGTGVVVLHYTLVANTETEGEWNLHLEDTSEFFDMTASVTLEAGSTSDSPDGTNVGYTITTAYHYEERYALPEADGELATFDSSSFSFPGPCSNLPDMGMSYNFDFFTDYGSFSFFEPCWTEDSTSTSETTTSVGTTSSSGTKWFPEDWPGTVTVTFVDIWLCADFEDEIDTCDPDDGGYSYCWNHISDASSNVLQDRDMSMYCSEDCIVEGGLWCQIFGIQGCRLCSDDCEEFCAAQEGDDCTCVDCPVDEEGSIVDPTATATSGTDECAEGEAGTCYDKLSQADVEWLDFREKKLICDESCASEGGLWCNALYTEGCRICAISCDSYRTRFCPGDADCPCYECPANDTDPTSSSTQIGAPCTVGDDDSCKSQVSDPTYQGLVSEGRELMCSSECLSEEPIGSALWCYAWNLRGCRYCAEDCAEWCSDHTDPDGNCDCYECP